MSTAQRGHGPDATRGTGRHYLLVTGIRDGRVYYTNPWGREESMSTADFEKILKGANLPAAKGRVKHRR